jgi:hypothetical protein
MEEVRNLKAISKRYMAGVTTARLAQVACKHNVYLVLELNLMIVYLNQYT